MSHAPVTILTSGIGLGVYIPALLIQRQLGRRRVVADVEVLEGYYTPESLRRYLAHKEAMRANFALAQMAHRMARDVQDCLDPERIDQLLAGWAREGRENFIVWSGFWLPILEEYRRRVPQRTLEIDLCRIDAEVSASFKVHRNLEGDGNEIWLWNWKDKAIVHEIPVTPEPPLPFARRESRLVVHGGGWGLGTYRSTLADLSRAGYALDIVIHDPAERVRYGPGDRCYLIDPAWHPWHRLEGQGHVFPSVGEVADDGTLTYHRNDGFHPFHSVIRRAKAIVSKPGGCTLIDSLASATPVVLLDAYGYAEQSNGAIWEHLGFGVPYAAWERTGFDSTVLEGLHTSLMARGRSEAGYPGTYAERLTRKQEVA